MAYAFIIKPTAYHAFENEAEQIEKCKEWGLLSEKATKTKAFYYKGNGMNVPCSIVGFVDKITAVIEFDNNKHCIHPSYLKEMQASNFGQKISVAAEETVKLKVAEVEAPQAPQEPQAPQVEAPPVEKAGIGEPSEAEAVEEAEEAAEAADAVSSKEKAKKSKPQKLQLPEEKVKMTATVKAFTTVPNHFSDNDDEVVVYESVSISEPETEIGEAWSSYSATLKKWELSIGDTISFEGKIVAKKLTKHPVPYKINNPAKIQKVQS